MFPANTPRSTERLGAAAGHFDLSFAVGKKMETGSSLHGAYVARQRPMRLFQERDPFQYVGAAFTSPFGTRATLTS